MGIGPFRNRGPSSCSVFTHEKFTPGISASLSKDKVRGNPDPKRFKILRTEAHSGWTVAEVQYPDATNYEGRKIMLYHCSVADLRHQVELDPHFCDDWTHLSPFARFEPTNRGWLAAVLYAKTVRVP